MVSRKRKTWVYHPSRKPKLKVPDKIKQNLQEKGDQLAEEKIKPEYLEPIPEKLTINHFTEIYTKWYRNYFYFCVRYKCPPEAVVPSFESKYARLEYVGDDKFELSYMRHTGKWWQLKTGTMDDCLESVSSMVPY